MINSWGWSNPSSLDLLFKYLNLYFWEEISSFISMNEEISKSIHRLTNVWSILKKKVKFLIIHSRAKPKISHNDRNSSLCQIKVSTQQIAFGRAFGLWTKMQRNQYLIEIAWNYSDRMPRKRPERSRPTNCTPRLPSWKTRTKRIVYFSPVNYSLIA